MPAERTEMGAVDAISASAQAVPRRSQPETTAAKRLSIAFVVHDYNRVLGHSRYVVELAERFAADHDVHVFANRFEQLPSAIVGHRVPAWRRYALLSILSFFVPASLMVRGRFDIVHAQGFAVFAPDIVTAHISNARWLEGRRLLEANQLSWRERLFAAVVIPAERRSLRDPAVTVIAVSSALRHDVAATYGRVAETVVIPHGVDQRQFHPGVREQFRGTIRRQLRIEESTVLFLYVGDLRKGFVPAIQALASVPNAHLLGISRTPARQYERLAADGGVRERMTILPATDGIERYYGGADVLVLPTPYDAFGMVITEALACGLPVITTKSAGASELLTDGTHGIVLNSATDIPTLAAAMTLLADRPETRARMGAAAAALMREHTWDRVAERTLAVYYAHLARDAQRW
jgi:UDP-glucose:(heptosyl)LPS alpha-1,3-glucosyltransferase